MWPWVRFMKGARWRASSYRPGQKSSCEWVLRMCVLWHQYVCDLTHRFLASGMLLYECDVVPHCSFTPKLLIMNDVAIMSSWMPCLVCVKLARLGGEDVVVFMIAMLWMPLAMVVYGFMNVCRSLWDSHWLYMVREWLCRWLGRIVLEQSPLLFSWLSNVL